ERRGVPAARDPRPVSPRPGVHRPTLALGRGGAAAGHRAGTGGGDPAPPRGEVRPRAGAGGAAVGPWRGATTPPLTSVVALSSGAHRVVVSSPPDPLDPRGVAVDWIKQHGGLALSALVALLVALGV